MPFPLLLSFLLGVDGIEISTWTSCFAAGDPCRLGERDVRPSFSDSFNLSSTSLPVARVLRFDDGTTEWEESASSFVPLSSFLTEVVDNLPEATNIGVLILQAGDSSVVEWRVSGCPPSESESSSIASYSPSSNDHEFNTEQSATSEMMNSSRMKRQVQEGVSINDLLESTDATLPTVQTYFDSSLWAYHFAGSQFTGNPVNFLQIPSTCSIGFSPVGNYSEKNYGNACRKSALTFAIFYADSDVPMKKIPVNKDTLKMLLSMRIGLEFIRICPMVEVEERSETYPEPVSQTETPLNEDDIERILSNSTVESKVELPATSSSGEEVRTTNETALHGNETESDWKETEWPESNGEKGKEGSTKMETTPTSGRFESKGTLTPQTLEFSDPPSSSSAETTKQLLHSTELNANTNSASTPSSSIPSIYSDPSSSTLSSTSSPTTPSTELTTTEDSTSAVNYSSSPSTSPLSIFSYPHSSSSSPTSKSTTETAQQMEMSEASSPRSNPSSSAMESSSLISKQTSSTDGKSASSPSTSQQILTQTNSVPTEHPSTTQGSKTKQTKSPTKQANQSNRSATPERLTVASSTTTSPPIRMVSGTLTPSLVDSSSDETITVRLNSSALKGRSLSIQRCWLDGGGGRTVDISEAIFTKKTGSINLTIHQSVMEGNATVVCRMSGAPSLFDVSSSSPLSFVSFADFVSASDGFVSQFLSQMRQKIVGISFSVSPLDPSLASGDPYCMEASGLRFPAPPSSSSLSCNVSSLTSPGTFKIYGIRSRILEEATLRLQTPLEVIIVESATTQAMTSSSTTEEWSTQTASSSTSTSPPSTTHSTSSSSPSSTPPLPSSTSHPPATTPIPSIEETTPSPSPLVPSIRFLDSLRGLEYESAVEIPIRLLSCADLFDTSRLGVNASCSSTGNGLVVSFGSLPSLLPLDSLPVSPSFANLTGATGVTSLYVLPALAPVIPNFTVAYDQEVMSCLRNVEIELKKLTGSGGREMEFTWKVVQGVSSQMAALASATTSRKITIPTRIISPNVSTILSITACNFASSCSSSTFSLLLSDAAAQFSVEIQGIDSRVLPSRRLSLSAAPSFVQCNGSTAPADVQYSWLINGAEFGRSASLRIAAHSLDPGANISIRLEATYTKGKHLIQKRPIKRSTQYSTSSSSNFTVSTEPLVAIVDATQRTSPSDKEITLDASSSSDPNFASALVNHRWTCANISNGSQSPSSDEVDECSLPSSIGRNSPTLQIPMKTLQPNTTLNFTDHISSATLPQITASVFSIVVIISPRSPVVRFEALAAGKINVDQFIRIRAFVSSSYGKLTTTWLVTLDSVPLDISAFLSSPSRTFTADETSSEVALSLTIPPGGQTDSPSWPGLSPGRQYSISLVASNEGGESSGFIQVTTNSPPTVGEIDCSPPLSSSLSALSPISFSLGDGWSDDDSPLTIRFGIATKNSNGPSSLSWLPSSSSPSASFVLSAALAPPHAACGTREEYTAMVEVCDSLSACSSSSSLPFHVQHAEDVAAAAEKLQETVEDHIQNGRYFSALDVADSIRQESCEGEVDEKTADSIVAALIRSVDSKSDATEYAEVLEAVTRLLGSVSIGTMDMVTDFVTQYQAKLGMRVSSSARKKRSTSSALVDVSTLATADVDSLLAFFDKSIATGNKVPSYFSTISSVLASACTQLDESTPRTIQKTGGIYTILQAQALVPSRQGFNGSSYKVAGVNANVISFGPSLISSFSLWQCSSSFQCLSICLGTLQIDSKAITDSAYLQDYFYPVTTAMSPNKSVSHIYRAYMMNPITGDVVTNSAAYLFKVPLSSYSLVEYYECFLYSNGIWDGSQCSSAEYAERNGTNYFFPCACTETGLLSVFSVSPPPPPDLPGHREVIIEFTLSSSSPVSSSQWSSFHSRLSKTTGILSARFVLSPPVTTRTTATAPVGALKASSSSSSSSSPFTVLSVTMRPPWTAAQTANNYAVQSILRVVAADGCLVAFDAVRVINATWSTKNRTLTNDGYARKIVLMINEKYSTVIGTANTTTALEAKWSSAIASLLRISQYRIKNAKISLGVIFNFTLTVPYHDEPGPVISAEELSIMIQEAIFHGELVLTSTADQPMGIMNLADDNIVILIPLPKSNTLVLILVLVVSTTVFLSLLYIGGAILFKARTDFLLEQERQRFLQLDASSLHPPPPSYPADVHMPTHIPARQFPVPPKTNATLSPGKRALSATGTYNSRARTAY